MKLNKYDLMLVGLGVLAVVLIIFDIYSVRQKNEACFANPLEYGVKQLSKYNNDDVTCTCSLASPNSQVLVVTKDGTSARNPFSADVTNSIVREINITDAFQSLNPNANQDSDRMG